MPTRVFLTIDTELMWRHHAAGHRPNTIIKRSLEPAGVGVSYQLARLSEFGLKACFFVDPMPALVYGIDALRPVVEAILDAGQEVQLHLHPNWAGARAGDHGAAFARFELVEYAYHEQRALIAQARALLVEMGAPPAIAFRSGSYAANDDTLRALAALGTRARSSRRWWSVGSPCPATA